MLPNVRKFISIEMIRDGGSFALKFEGGDPNHYILFTKIRFTDIGPEKKDQRGYHQEKEVVGYDEPVIIDCDPAKRPQDTKTRIYSELCGPESRLSWDQARQIIREAGVLVPDLSPIHASWLKQMTDIVEADGHPPPGSQTGSTWTRPLSKGPESATDI